MDTIDYMNVVMVDYRKGFVDTAIGVIIGMVFLLGVFYLAILIFMISSWIFIIDYREEKSIREIIFPKSLDQLINQVSECFNCLFNTEKHVILLLLCFLLIISSSEIPIGHFKTYGTLEFFSPKGEELIDSYFPDSYNIAKHEHTLVVEKGSRTEKIVDYIFKTEEDKESSKYFFTSYAAMIRGYTHYEEGITQEYFSYDDIYLITDYLKAYILSIWDAIMRAFIYGLAPYIIGTIILNRKQIDNYYRNQIE